MEAVALSVITVFSTAIGGVVALTMKSHLTRLLAFGSGAILGIALFDLLPEALKQAESAGLPQRSLFLAVAAGFVLFHVLGRASLLGASHDHGGTGSHNDVHPLSAEERAIARRQGTLAAMGFSIHSFLDGAAIGVGFHAGTTVGIAIAIAVIAHDAADGLNTVTVMLSHGHTTRRSMIWLAVDALAPVLGAIMTFLAPIGQAVLAPLLGGFVGFFLYIGAADMLPDALRRDRGPWPTALLLGGIAFAYVVVSLLAL